MYAIGKHMRPRVGADLFCRIDLDVPKAFVIILVFQELLIPVKRIVVCDEYRVKPQVMRAIQLVPELDAAVVWRLVTAHVKV